MSHNPQTVVVFRQDDFNFNVNNKQVINLVIRDMFGDPVQLNDVKHKVNHLTTQERNAFQNWIDQNHCRRVKHSIYTV